MIPEPLPTPFSEEWIRKLELGERVLAPESAERKMRAHAAESTPEQFAALHGPNTLVFGFPRYIFRDPELDAWVQEVGSILRDPDRLDSCMRRHLSAEDYERARSDME